MGRWIYGAGIVLMAVGAAMLSPLVDLLPAGPLRRPGESTVYFRAVPTTASRTETVAWILLISGLIAAMVGGIADRRKR